MNKKETSNRRRESVAQLKLSLRRFVVALLVSSYEASESAGFNATDLGALCLLLLQGPTSAGQLAESLGVTTGAATGIADRLEQGGFVQREADPRDRRKVILRADRERVDRDLFPHFPMLQTASATSFYDEYTIAQLELVEAFLARLLSADQ